MQQTPRSMPASIPDSFQMVDFEYFELGAIEFSARAQWHTQKDLGVQPPLNIRTFNAKIIIMRVIQLWNGSADGAYSGPHVL